MSEIGDSSFLQGDSSFLQGDFSFLRIDGNMMKDMYNTINNQENSIEIWEFLKNYDKDGFMTKTPKIIIDLCRKCETNHSGTSMAYTFTHMTNIAKNGWDKYVISILNKNINIK
jgi:hypothetical protein